MKNRFGMAALLVIATGLFWTADAMRASGGGLSERLVGVDEPRHRAQDAGSVQQRSLMANAVLGVGAESIRNNGTIMPQTMQLQSGSAKTGKSNASETPATPADFRMLAPVRIPTGEREARAVAVADVTGDGRDDIVVSVSSEAEPGQVALLFPQTGSGTLAAPRALTVEGGSYYPGLVLGHLDKDGIMDVVVGYQGGVSVFNHANDFSPVLAQGTVDAQYLVMLPLNGDKHPDLFAHSWSHGGDVFLGNGTGGVSHQQAVPTAAWGRNTLRTGDLNGDGFTDVLLASSQGFERGFWVYPGQAAGGLGAPVFHELFNFPLQGPGSATVGDFNNDGRDDVVLSYSVNMPEARLVLKLQRPDGTLGPESVIEVFEIPEALTTADLDGNGLDDVIVSHGGWQTVGYLLQTEQGLGEEVLVQLPEMPFTSSGGSDSVAVGDVNADRCPDIVMINWRNDVVVIHGQNCLPKPPPMAGPSRPRVLQ